MTNAHEGLAKFLDPIAARSILVLAEWPTRSYSWALSWACEIAFEFYRSNITGFMDIDIDDKNGNFPGNSQGTCAAQTLDWFMELAGQLKSGTGLSAQLLSTYEKCTELQFGLLDNGNEMTTVATETVDRRGVRSAENIKKMTPWSGTYKAYGIASDRGHGHMIGAYFPWTGSVKFYDPNLVIGTCKADANIYELLKLWPSLYDGVEKALWGQSMLFVIKDPDEALEKLKKVTNRLGCGAGDD